VPQIALAASWLENAGRILARSAQRVKAIISGDIGSAPL